MPRKKITEESKAEVVFKSNRECCVCNKRGDQIHHIDGDNSNSNLDNLAFLCFDCHNEASMTGNLRIKLSPKIIIKYRDHKYKQIATMRENSLKVFNSPIKELTTEDLLTITKNAVIIIELEKIKEECFSVAWDKRSDIIDKLNKFSEHTNFRVAYDIYDFLSSIAGQTRAGMTPDVASSIFSVTIVFFPNIGNGNNKKIIELANQCLDTANEMVYDALIHLKNQEIAKYGLNLLKFVYRIAKRAKIPLLTSRVNSIYSEIKLELHKPGLGDLNNAIKLVEIFKDDIDVNSLAFPPSS